MHCASPLSAASAIAPATHPGAGVKTGRKMTSIVCYVLKLTHPVRYRMPRGDGSGVGVGVAASAAGGGGGGGGYSSSESYPVTSLARVPGGSECSASLIVFLPIFLVLLALGAPLLAPRL